MAKYKIVHDREGCIGCGACVASCPDYWQMKEDKKSFLKGSKKAKDGKYELELDEPGCNKAAESSCPVSVIRIEKNSSG